MRSFSSLLPFVSWILKIEFSLNLMKLRILFLNGTVDSIFQSSSIKLFHSLIKQASLCERLTTLAEKRSFPPNLGHKFFLEVLALLDVRHCPKLQSCAISRKINDTALRKWQKLKFRTQFFFMGFFHTRS